MPIQATYVRTDVFHCVSCDLGTGPIDDLDIEGDDDALNLPPGLNGALGWLKLTVDDVVRNPDYDDEVAARELKINVLYDEAVKANAIPKDLPADRVKNEIRDQQKDIESHEYVVETRVIALCPSCRPKLKEIGVEDEEVTP